MNKHYFVDIRPANVIANIVICLIYQANYQLNRRRTVELASEWFV